MSGEETLSEGVSQSEVAACILTVCLCWIAVNLHVCMGLSVLICYLC